MKRFHAALQLDARARGFAWGHFHTPGELPVFGLAEAGVRCTPVGIALEPASPCG